ncbi:unnamed protein product [Candida verbasci]|uniref:CAP-Gly domain-containing protein n=1 Tax=Candida verbasci TaxID=1227364 RepID=A0A9W4TS19_9ASCO|nr:unnamed protein product [Candida verbasci]
MSDINIFITSDLTSSERRISPQWNLRYLKEKLRTITGIEPDSQIIKYFPNQYSNEFNEIKSDNDEELLLSQLNLKSMSRIHVEDLNPDSISHQLSNDNVKEYKYTEEEYKTRSNSVLNWKQSNKLGRFDPEYEEILRQTQLENEEKISKMSIGDRCRIINIEGERRGCIKFIGRIEYLDKGENYWIGIEFDEPVGKNSGYMGGKKLFDCKPNHGSVVKPKQVEVGDFPELDPFDDDDEEL